jgi:5-methylcytosine-specific restriction endonuclease McrA
MGSREGAQKGVATRLGLTVSEYLDRLARGEKRCTTCRAWHPVSAFGLDRSRTDGLDARCLVSKRVPENENPSLTVRRSMAKMGLAWCRECRWWLAAAELLPGGLCKPHQREAERCYYQTNPARHSRGTNRRMRGIPTWWRAEMMEGPCAYCDKPAKTLDHFIPVSMGGRTEPGNLVPACKSCNSRKRDSDPLAWVDRLRGEHQERLSECGWVLDGAIAEIVGV